MRRAYKHFLAVTAAVVAAAATAGAANVVVQRAAPPAQPVLRTGSVTVPVASSKPALRASAIAAPKVKVVVAHGTKAVVGRKVTVAVRVKAAHRRIAAHAAPSIALPMDEVRVVAFSQPISTIYVGNPMIADDSLIDNKHAFVLGKSFGATNIVALNADGKQVVNDSVTVFGHTGNTVILHRGTAQATYACAGARCESSPVPGDDKDSFSSRMEQVNSHQDAGLKAASAAH